MSPTGVIGVGASRLANAPEPFIADRAASARREQSPSRRVAVLSEATAIYDARGSYPAYRMFQYAKPLPESKPYKGLDLETPPSLFAKSYTRSAPPRATFIDQRQ